MSPRLGLLSRAKLAAQMLTGNPGGAIQAFLSGSFGEPPRRGTRELLETFRTSPWVHAAGSKVAFDVGSATWRAFVVRRRGERRAVRTATVREAQRARSPVLRRRILERCRKQGELVEVEDARLLDFLGDLNPYFPGNGVARLSQVYEDLVGESLWIFVRDGLGVPASAWPIPPHWIRELPTRDRPTFIVETDEGQRLEPPVTEVLWAFDPDPVTPYKRGLGLGKAIADEVDVDEFAAQHTRAFFSNRAVPTFLGILRGADGPTLKRFSADWENSLRGQWKAWAGKWVNVEAEIKELGQKFGDLGMVELRKSERDVIRSVWGVPPEILGITENSNRAHALTARQVYGTNVLVPRLEFWRSVYQAVLVPQFDDRIVLDYESPVPEDHEAQLEAAKAAPWALELDEWRRLAGEDELPDGAGKVHMVPINLSPVRLDDGDAFVPEPPPTPDPEEERALPSGTRRALPVPSRPPMRRKQGGFHEAARRIADRLEPRLRRIFADAVEDLRGRVDEDLLGTALAASDLGLAAQATALAEFASLLEERGVRQVLAVGASEGGAVAAAELSEILGVGVSFDQANPFAVTFAETQTAELVREVTSSTREALRLLVAEATQTGIPPRELAGAVRNWVGLTSRQTATLLRRRAELLEAGRTATEVAARMARQAEAMTRRRALLIARTETLRAANGGQQLAWEQAVRDGHLDAARVRRVWIVTEDDRLDAHICEPMPFMDENRDVGLDEPFTTPQGVRLMFPPAHPACRCAVAMEVRRS